MEAELNLHDYWRIIKKRQWLGLTVFTATFLSTVFYTHLQVPLYRAQAMVKFEPPPAKILNANASWDPGVAIQTQLRVLSSADMLDRLAQRLKVPVANIPGSITSQTVESSNLLIISVSGVDPVAAADVANAFVDSYIERDFEDRTQQGRLAVHDIESRRAEVESSLRELEESRKSFLQDNPMTSVGTSLAGALNDLEMRRKELAKKYTPEHPEMIKLEQRIRQTRAQLDEAPKQEMELDRLNRDIKVNEETYLTLSREFEEAKVTLASAVSWVSPVAKATVPTAPYAPNKRVNYVIGATLGLFLAALLAFVLENLDISLSTIEEIEKLLGVPVLGIIPHFGADRRWRNIRARLLRHQRYPIETFRSQLVFHHRPKSPVIEVYHSLRANIHGQLPRRENLALTFTSTGVAEGKSLTSLNTCLAAAQVGLRTLYVEADVRQAVSHKVFGLSRTPGLMEVLTGKMRWEDVLNTTSDFLMGGYDMDDLIAFSGIDNLKLMTGWAASGADVVNTLSSAAVPRLIAELRPHFDLIVFDCPPVLLFVDALLIAPHTDGVVMVYKAGKMPRRALKRAKDQIAAAKGNIVGVALNDMHSSDMEPRYGSYDDYSHYARKEERSTPP